MAQRLDKKEFLKNAKSALEGENNNKPKTKTSKKKSCLISLEEEDFNKLLLSASVVTNGNKSNYIKRLIDADYAKNKECYENMKKIQEQWK